MTPEEADIEWKRALAKERRDAREGAAKLIAAAIAGDAGVFGIHYESVSQETIGGIDRFFRAIARMEQPLTTEVQREFTFQWITHKSARGGTQHDRVMLAALRKLLLPYAGPAISLYGGASLAEKRYGAFGISWTSNRQIAERFAEHPIARMRHAAGGSGVYETVAPPDAILGTSLDIGDPYSECEYFVDRRRLKQVRVISKHSHLELAEAAEVMAELDARYSSADT